MFISLLEYKLFCELSFWKICLFTLVSSLSLFLRILKQELRWFYFRAYKKCSFIPLVSVVEFAFLEYGIGFLAVHWIVLKVSFPLMCVEGTNLLFEFILVDWWAVWLSLDLWLNTLFRLELWRLLLMIACIVIKYYRAVIWYYW